VAGIAIRLVFPLAFPFTLPIWLKVGREFSTYLPKLVITCFHGVPPMTRVSNCLLGKLNLVLAIGLHMQDEPAFRLQPELCPCAANHVRQGCGVVLLDHADVDKGELQRWNVVNVQLVGLIGDQCAMR
jgi:hypothetical protein